MTVNMAGRTVLVTGATSGIGLEASVMLAKLGATVVMVGRDPAKSEAALADVRARSGSSAVSMLRADFAAQADVRRLAAEYRAAHDRLDVLVNNAGTVSEDRRLSPDGIELTFAVNHLGYFLLTNLLLDLLKRSAPARIVNVSSIGHRGGDLDLADLQFERGGYSIMKAYRRSKLANVLFTRELAQRLAGTGVTVTSMHPGGIASNIWSKAPAWSQPILALAKLFMESTETGGQRIVHLAASPEVEGVTGAYFEKNRQVEPARLAKDERLAKALWDVSAKMVGLEGRTA